MKPHCFWCGRAFESDNVAQKVCSTMCHRARKKRITKLNASGTRKCRTPFKVPFGNRGNAIRAAYQKGMGFYPCNCGVYHLTSLTSYDNVNQANMALERYKLSLTVTA